MYAVGFLYKAESNTEDGTKEQKQNGYCTILLGVHWERSCHLPVLGFIAQWGVKVPSASLDAVFDLTCEILRKNLDLKDTQRGYDHKHKNVSCLST